MRYGDLAVSVHDEPAAMGRAVAEAFASAVRRRVEADGSVGVVVQTGGSQRPFYEALADRSDIDWSRVELFHLDEFVGLSGEHPVSFRRWIREHVAERFGVRAFHELRGDAPDPEAEARRYGALLRDRAPQVAVMSIGEEGQLGFNEPPAELVTLEPVLVVALAAASRQALVGSGGFEDLEDTPSRVLTMSVPALLAAETVLVVVPEQRKAGPVQAALEGPVTRAVPASALRLCPRAHLHLDRASASALARD
ncbi:MAG: 6-phosphogluconolactonase [Egibacteraceae bacterium]